MRTTVEADGTVYEVLVNGKVQWQKRVRRSPKRGATPFTKAAREQERVAARFTKRPPPLVKEGGDKEGAR